MDFTNNIEEMKKNIEMKEKEKENDGEPVKFGFQFLVSSSSMINISIMGNYLFKKSEYTEIKPMRIPPIAKNPEEHYQKILDDFTKPLLDAFVKLKNTINEYEIEEDLKHKKDELREVEVYVSVAIDMCIKHIKVINRVKMERMMIIIKTGINSHCNYDILEALVELDCLVRLFCPSDRRFMCENESSKFKKSIVDLTVANPHTIVKLLDTIKLDATTTECVRDILLKLIKGDRSKILKIIVDYILNINKVETVINSTVSINETFRLLNESQKEFTEGDFKPIEFSLITISVLVIDGEMYVDYFGYIDIPVGGSFSVDFYRFRNLINDNITHYLFYLVTCHYCLMYKTNILDVNFDLVHDDIQSMFIFFEDRYMSKIMDATHDIQMNICHKKIFANLYRFFYEIMEKPKPEKRNIVKAPGIEQKKEEHVTHQRNPNQKPSERLTMIKKRNNDRKNKN